MTVTVIDLWYKMQIRKKKKKNTCCIFYGQGITNQPQHFVLPKLTNLSSQLLGDTQDRKEITLALQSAIILLLPWNMPDGKI